MERLFLEDVLEHPASAHLLGLPSEAHRGAFSILSSTQTAANIQDTTHRQHQAEENADNA